MKTYKKKRMNFWNLVADKSSSEREWLRYGEADELLDLFLLKLFAGNGEKFSVRYNYWGEQVLYGLSHFQMHARWAQRLLEAVADELGVQGRIKVYPIMNTERRVVDRIDWEWVFTRTTASMIIEFAPSRRSVFEVVKGLFS